MRNARVRLAGECLLWLALMWLTIPGTVAADEPEEKPDELIGEVLGKKVYRHDIVDDVQGQQKLHQVFLTPVLEKYKKAHQKEIVPTKEELAAASVVLDKQWKEKAQETEPEITEALKKIEGQLAEKDLPEAKRKELTKEKQSWERIRELHAKPPGPLFAQFMLSNWKFQKHLYDNFGGGRILWQQAGIEAFDAMHTFLESREKAGDFKITDKKLRDKLYEYWTTHKHGAFLIDDPERIKKEFLEPTWAPKPRQRDSVKEP